MLDLLEQRFRANAAACALIAGDARFTYADLLSAISHWQARFARSGIVAGSVVLLKGDFTLDAIGALFALMRIGAITILLAPSSFEKEAEFADTGRAQFVVDTLSGGIQTFSGDGVHPLYDQLRAGGDAGIILFSSGSAGASKGTVHNASHLLEKFRPKGKNLRTLAFLLFDHIAGLDTLLYSLANTSTLVLAQVRTPDEVCRLIALHRVQVLPTAPSFLNLLLLAGAAERHDLSSLEIVTYGSEMMAQSTLDRCAAALPNVRLIQKYGTSETGAFPTQSRSSTSTWLKLGGEGFEWRVRDGKFEARTRSTMLGYLNEPSPFTEDGFFMTGDRVEVDGEYVRFLGRDSDMINVGGQKVFPAEVEALISQMPEVAEVAVYGEPHAILGAAVVAKIWPAGEISAADLRKSVRAHLTGQVEPYKIPQKLILVDQPLTSSRFKTIRRSGS
ncbi:AMP-binding protein [Hyphomonas sp.]|uniref:AMP-binding protein n=1 Tax=Hyphomonas sp. TaxID=87 RepID=UPI003919B7BE